MKGYKEAITLSKNNRGCYILDTVKGCPGSSMCGGRGCYGDCYAKHIADRYGFDFQNPRARRFMNNTAQLYFFGLSDKAHTNRIIREIESSDMPFVRVGEMGDPSFDWRHTLDVCKEISGAGKKIVIITKHWEHMPDILLNTASKLKLCINTSVSALDNERELEYRLEQYERLGSVCNSVLRIVSCDFNRDNSDGLDKSIIQDELFKLGPCIDTVFRPSSKNHFVVKGIIKTKKVGFLRSSVLASMHDPGVFMGMCKDCPDLCGVAEKFTTRQIVSGRTRTIDH